MEKKKRKEKQLARMRERGRHEKNDNKKPQQPASNFVTEQMTPSNQRRGSGAATTAGFQ